MRKQLRNIQSFIGFGAICGMLLVGNITFTGCASQAAEQEVTESVEIVEEESSEISVFGKVEALDAQEIYIDFPASVTEVFVEEGQSVKAGDQLMQLDYEPYKNTIEVAAVEKELNKINTQDSVQQVNAISSEINSLQEEKSLKQSYLQESNYQIQTLEQSLKVIEDKLEKYKNDYETEKTLVEAGASAEDNLKNLQLQIDGLEVEKQNTAKQLQNFKESTKLQITQLDAGIKAKEDERTQKQATNSRAQNKQILSSQISDLNIQNMNTKLNKTYLQENCIVSDLENAIVDEIKCEKGSYIGQNGASYCMKLLDTNSIQIIADVPEEFISQITVGQTCNVVPYYNNMLNLEGKVVRIDKRAIKEDGEVIVKVYVELSSKTDEIMPGLSVDVIF
ncbi:MAG: HlyD family efflux transporter periplasmic adaptor subunit [Cellulosilyticum sp.]|nr:HlyD family efflux transporter periplasmic adaptor subunit [Cellulosilyticum sp.]